MSTDMTNDLLINAQKKKMEMAMRRKKREEEAAERERVVLKWWEEAHIKGQATKPPVYDVNAIVDMYGQGSGKNRLTMTEVQKMMKVYVKTAGAMLHPCLRAPNRAPNRIVDYAIRLTACLHQSPLLIAGY